jgi:purine-binding chemotaxis protein CheW
MKNATASQIVPSARSNGQSRDLLKARARELARRAARKETAGRALEVVEFRLAQERYAIEQRQIREVHLLNDLTSIPCTPAFVLGIINVRGRIVSVIDIRKFFDLPEAGITDMHTVIIVQASDMELGILADAITGCRAIALANIQPSLPTLTGIRAAYLKGVTDDHVVILDVANMLADPKILVNDEVEI